MDKLFIVVREDQPPGLMMAQAIHAARAFQAAHPDIEAAWFRDSNTVVVLGVPDEDALSALGSRCRAAGSAERALS